LLSPASAAGSALGRSLPVGTLRTDVAAAVLASRDGAPVSGYVLDPAVATRRARQLRAALPAWAKLLYAVKANGSAPIVEALLAEGGVDGLEVASTSEARLAASLLSAGSPLAAAGPAKHAGLLADLLDHGVSVVHAESVTELHRLDALALARGARIPVALRVNPARVGVIGTLAMGGRSSAFGIPERDVPAAVAVAQSLVGIDLVGFHMHAVSGNRDARAHAAYVAWVLEWSVATALETGIELRWVDAGGGLGVSYDGTEPLDLAVLAEELDELTPPGGVEVVLEPGRWLAADCGWYAAEVVDIKESHDGTFVLIRGGINGYCLPATEDFPLPVVVLPVEDWDEPFERPGRQDVTVTVSGELCTPEDVLVRDVVLDWVRVGDVLVFPQAGAYGYEFALRDFLGHPAPTRTFLPAGVPAPSLP
jgi:2-[(L-alanin-3-ylcarbamoyl)methyl]-2-hydroxybutanedioate decarboxylase